MAISILRHCGWGDFFQGLGEVGWGEKLFNLAVSGFDDLGDEVVGHAGESGEAEVMGTRERLGEFADFRRHFAVPTPDGTEENDGIGLGGGILRRCEHRFHESGGVGAAESFERYDTEVDLGDGAGEAAEFAGREVIGGVDDFAIAGIDGDDGGGGGFGLVEERRQAGQQDAAVVGGEADHATAGA